MQHVEAVEHMEALRAALSEAKAVVEHVAIVASQPYTQAVTQCLDRALVGADEEQLRAAASLVAGYLKKHLSLAAGQLAHQVSGICSRLEYLLER